MKIVLAATGHRPERLGGYDSRVAMRLRDLAVSYLLDDRPDEVISGMALGWDQAVAWAAVDLAIPFIAAVPCVGQEGKWPERSQAEYRRLCARAATTVVVSEGGYSPQVMAIRDRWMVDNCNRLVALWDGSPSGTGKTVGYAIQRKRPWVNLWDRWSDPVGSMLA